MNRSRHQLTAQAYGYDQRLEAFGSEGTLLFDNVRPTTVQASTRAAAATKDPSPTLFLDCYADSYHLELEAFVTPVQTGTPCSPEYLDGKRALELACAAAESAATGRTVRIATDF
jgi:myo-inositol 2-dehydrogenase/D-chiro-inositol 1-dehydrogenase